ncbi:MAG: hypothetical protein QG672_972, partial [Pseudomonadota bacterium]|nr:hypothetical protein [Pseudomonadota bacterium]
MGDFEVAAGAATPYVFMRGESGECFGPFDWSSETVEVDGVTSFEISLKFITGGGLGAAGSTKQIYQIADDVITARARSVEIDGRVRRVAANVVAITNGALYFDYASD